MAINETLHYKALYFDLSVKNLSIYFSDPRNAYHKIRNYLTQRNFSHEQYSGYHSLYKTTDLDIFDLVVQMSEAFPWLEPCMNHFEVTDVEANHDLIRILRKPSERLNTLCPLCP